MNMAGYPSFKSIWRLFYCRDQIIGDYLEIILLSIPNIIIWENIWRLFCRQAQMVIEVKVRVRCIILHWVTMTSYLLAPALFNSKKIYLLISWLWTNWRKKIPRLHCWLRKTILFPYVEIMTLKKIYLYIYRDSEQIGLHHCHSHVVGTILFSQWIMFWAKYGINVREILRYDMQRHGVWRQNKTLVYGDITGLHFSSAEDDIIFIGASIVHFKKTFLLPYVEIMSLNKFISIIAIWSSIQRQHQ